MGFRPGDSSEFMHDETNVTVKPNTDAGLASRIPDAAGFVTVGSNTTDTSDYIILPASKVGRIINGYSLTAHKMRTAETGAKINDVVADGAAYAAITATYNWTAKCVASNSWVLTVTTKLGAAGTTVVPA